MAIVHNEISPFMNYFLCLEDDILTLSRWVEFSEQNEDVYSVEIARLLMTACSEIDVIAKLLCKAIGRSADNINKYQDIITEVIPKFHESKVSMPKFGKNFCPWSNWSLPHCSPDWWQGYNKVKHERIRHFQKANLKNTLNAMAALCLLLVLYQSSEGGDFLNPKPKLFFPESYVTNSGGELRFFLHDGVNVPWK